MISVVRTRARKICTDCADPSHFWKMCSLWADLQTASSLSAIADWRVFCTKPNAARWGRF